MAITRKPTPRARPLDLDRRAKLLGVTPGHLSQVLNGKRLSENLTARLHELPESKQIKN